MVLTARRAYHAFPDVAAQRLNGRLFSEGDILTEVEIVDFYRYYDVPVSEVYRHLKDAVGWSRPMDTGRSTNCLINDVGIYVHKARRGHHNYALPYSWDVRLGHKTWTEAVEELDDTIDVKRVHEILDEIGFDEPHDKGAVEPDQLVMYYTSKDGVAVDEMRRALLAALPREVVPSYFVQIDSLPVTANGKVDGNALPTPDFAPPIDAATDDVDDENLTATERALVAIWRRVLGNSSISVRANFYDVGGDSLTAIQIAAQCSKAGLAVTPQDIFRRQSVAMLAGDLDASDSKANAEQVRPQARARSRSARLSRQNTAALAAALGKKTDV